MRECDMERCCVEATLMTCYPVDGAPPLAFGPLQPLPESGRGRCVLRSEKCGKMKTVSAS